MESMSWRETTLHERNRRIFADEIDPFLPDRVLDFHVHLLSPGVLPAGETYNCAGHRVRRYGLPELTRDLAEIYLGRETLAVCFGFPDPAYDQRRNDAYVAAQCDRRRFFPFRLVAPDEDRDVLRRDLCQGRFLGLKPYPDYVRSRPLAEVEVDDMLPPWIMEIAHELRLPIVLHLPRPGRLADPLNQQQVKRLCRRYPQATIILAHVGRAYFLRGVVGQLEALKKLPNLYVDLAMLNHAEVLEYLFRTFPEERILYGTDLPIAVAPGKSVEINHQYTYITPAPWPLAIHDATPRIRYTSFLYEELRAIFAAAKHAGRGKPFLRRLFCDNGGALLGVGG